MASRRRSASTAPSSTARAIRCPTRSSRSGTRMPRAAPSPCAAASTATATRVTGFGRAAVDRDGHYAFTTIKPGATRADAAPYVLVTVFARGLLHHLFTRAYFDDEAERNARDPFLAGVDPARRARSSPRPTARAATASTSACRARARPCSSSSRAWRDDGPGRVRLGTARAARRAACRGIATTPCWPRSSTWSGRCVLAWGDVSDDRRARGVGRRRGRAARRIGSTGRRCSPVPATRRRARDPARRRSCAHRPSSPEPGRGDWRVHAARPARTSSTPRSCSSRSACSTTCAAGSSTPGTRLAALAERERSTRRDRPHARPARRGRPPSARTSPAGSTASLERDRGRRRARVPGAARRRRRHRARLRASGMPGVTPRLRAATAARARARRPRTGVAHRAHARAVDRRRRRRGRRGAAPASDGTSRSSRAPRSASSTLARAGGSSAMPHKRNPSTPCSSPPTGCGRPASSPPLHAAAVSQDARPAGEWHAEWQAFRSLLRLAAESADAAAELVAGLTVERDAIARDARAEPGARARRRPRCVVAAGAVVDAAVARFHAVDGGRTMTVPRLTGSVTAAAPTADATELLVLLPSLGTTTELWDGVVAALASGAARGADPARRPARPRRQPGRARAVHDRRARRRRAPRWSTRSAADASTSPASRSAGRVALELAVAASDRVASLTMLASGARIGTADGWAERAASVRASGTASLVAGSAQRWFAPGYLDARARRAGRAGAAPARRRRRRVVRALLRGARRVRPHRGRRRPRPCPRCSSRASTTGSPRPTAMRALAADVPRGTVRRARRRRAPAAARSSRRGRGAPRRAGAVDGCRDARSRGRCRDPRHGRASRRARRRPRRRGRRRDHARDRAVPGLHHPLRVGRGLGAARAVAARTLASPRSRASSPAATKPRSACTCAPPCATASTRAEIAEVILHTALYAGLPAANAALAIAREVFAEDRRDAEETDG